MKKLNIVQYESQFKSSARAEANAFISTLDRKDLVSVEYTTTILNTYPSGETRSIEHTFTIVHMHPC